MLHEALTEKNDKDQHFNYSWPKFNIYKVIMNKKFSMINPYKNHNNVFFKKNSFGQMDHFGPKMMHYENFESTPIIFLKFCTMKGSKRYIKILLL